MTGSIVTLPPALPVEKQDFGYRSHDLAHSNDDTGSGQVEVNGPVQRTCTLASEPRIPVPAEAALWRALVQSMNGQVNRIAVHDLLQPAPRGSARGNWVAHAAAAGASAITIEMGVGQAGATLLIGDWIGVNQDSVHRQLLHVQADAVADGAGVMTVPFAFVLRTAVQAGSTVVWNRPTCLMARTDATNTWSSQANSQGAFSLDLVERWG